MFEWLKKKRFHILIFIIGMLLGIVLTYILNNKHSDYAPPLRLYDKRYPLTGTLLTCSQDSEQSFYGLKSLQTILEHLSSNIIEQKQAEQVSIYFRDLNTGRWSGIEENEKYIPASLIKVPLLIAYLKLAERNTQYLQQKIHYTGTLNETKQQRINQPTSSIETGKSYTIDSLLQYMIIESDNNAYKVLYALIDKKILSDVYTDLHLNEPAGSINGASVSAKQFSYFLRVLYNTSYISSELSEYALEMLSKTSFKNGIVSGITDTTKVAHKFGERTVLENDKLKFRELHDCGIVYHPTDPYIVCIMTRGQDFTKLTQVLHDISERIYKAVNNHEINFQE